MDEKQNLEKIVKYIMDNKFRKLNQAETAKATGYSVSAFGNLFSRYFELPFAKFIKKLNLRQAAMEVAREYETLDIIGKRNGFQSKTFYNAFRQEFGMTPGQFHGKKLIPDMPCKTNLNQCKITMAYETVGDVMIDGYPVRVQNGEKTDLLDEAAYVFRHPGTQVDLKNPEKQWGIWWHDRKHSNQLCYVFGPKAREEKEVGKNRIRLRIKGGRYAVFAIEKAGNYFDIAKNSRELAWYVFKIWKEINQKRMDTMGYTYEVFDEKYAYLYVPLVKGFGGIEVENEMGHTIEKIVRYVDSHILEELDAGQVAAHFGRSDFYVRDRFRACFQISLPDYIRRKKLYVLTQKLKDREISREDITGQYGFVSWQQYCEEFRREFGIEPEKYETVSVELLDLKEYFSDNISQLKMSIQVLEDFEFMAADIKSGEKKEELDFDVPGLAAFWILQGLPQMQENDTEMPEEEIEQEDGEKEEREIVSLYEAVQEENGEDRIYRYVLGPVRKEGESIPEGMHTVSIEGGKYMVFESVEESDADNLSEVIRRIVRCVDHVWIYDNWIRTDMKSRISFKRYKNQKIYYYIPIYR